MSDEFDLNLNKYIDVIMKVGLNLQQGQRLLIGIFNPLNAGTPLELAPFVRKIVKKAYQMGAKFVEVMWNDPQITQIRLENAPKDSFEEVPKWRMKGALEYAEKGEAVLAIAVQNPDLFLNHDPQLVMTQVQALTILNKPVFDLIIKNNLNWLMIAAPVEGWAEKIFNEPHSDELNRKLWDKIFQICRVKQEDPISAWNKHINNLNTRCKYLNEKQYRVLRVYGPGTDLKIGLVKNHIWRGGNFESKNGITFVPNLPTEEICTLPERNKTEGTVKATKSLFFGGTIIEDFSFKFSNGKVVEYNATSGKEFLENIINYDDGAKYLGEIALVPHSSPISQSDLLFYNPLIDENASIHIALGSGYKFCIKNGEEMNDKDFGKAGGNLSILHMDFMIGSEETKVDGIKEDGKVEPIMKNGEWAFNVSIK